MKIIKITVASIVAIVLVAGIFLFKGELAPKEVDAKYTSGHVTILYDEKWCSNTLSR